MKYVSFLSGPADLSGFHKTCKFDRRYARLSVVQVALFRIAVLLQSAVKPGAAACVSVGSANLFARTFFITLKRVNCFRAFEEPILKRL